MWREIAKPFDTVSVCLSKGLGAPIGYGARGRGELIAKARRPRKALGGGLRQVGVLAAAGLYALEHNVERLAEDHANARRLAAGLRGIPALKVTPPDTNIVWVTVAPPHVARLHRFRGCRRLRHHLRLRRGAAALGDASRRRSLRQSMTEAIAS